MVIYIVEKSCVGNLKILFLFSEINYNQYVSRCSFVAYAEFCLYNISVVQTCCGRTQTIQMCDLVGSLGEVGYTIENVEFRFQSGFYKTD